jgi:hypothetical protein
MVVIDNASWKITQKAPCCLMKQVKLQWAKQLFPAEEYKAHTQSANTYLITNYPVLVILFALSHPPPAFQAQTLLHQAPGGVKPYKKNPG